MSIVEKLMKEFEQKEFTLQQAYEANYESNKESVRARIYENLGVKFEKVKRGVYRSIDSTCLLVEGDGRNLDFLPDSSIECIITDHPYKDEKSHSGGNRNFASYESFQYTQEDFNEKARVLKDGCFLCEFIPAENENNYEYLYKIKQYAKKAGFNYYSKVSWIKTGFVANTGRKAKNSEEVIIFSKGKARDLRLDAKKTAATGIVSYMSGANGMLPAAFEVPPVPKKFKVHQAEKPIELLKQLINFLSKTGETVLDSFAGSGVLGEACLLTSRNAILIEKDKESIEKIKARLSENIIFNLTAC